jgi:ABC-2 type transport system permease protein
MTGMLLVAAREFRQALRTRGFWVTLLSMPLIIVIATAAATLHGHGRGGPGAGAYVLVDATGRYAPTIQARLARAGDLAPAAAPPDLPLAKGSDAVGHALAPLFAEPVAVAGGRRPLAAAIYIPRDFGASGEPARIWSAPGVGAPAEAAVRSALGDALRREALVAAGTPAPQAARIASLEPPVKVAAPAVVSRGDRVMARSVLPIALVYLLLITSMTTGSLMLQGLIEERANRLLEAVLACIRPDELMYGKLAGLGAVGLLVAAVWAACAAAAALAPQGALAGFLAPSFHAFAQPGMLLGVLFYFLAGYVVIATIFLAIGALSESMQDAQAFLTPTIMLVVLPPTFMMQFALRDPDGILVRTLSWIPVYTPFAMLVRLATGVGVAEIVGTGLLLAAFVALELVLLGRVFRQSLLRTGQPPRLAAVAKLMFRRSDA